MKPVTAADPVKTAAEKGATPLLSLSSPLFKDVKVELKARLGHAELTVEELLALRDGSIVKLDLSLNGVIELHLNDTVVARGEIVAVDDNFGVRILELPQAK